MKIWICFICCFSCFAQEVDLERYDCSVYNENGSDGVVTCLLRLINPTERFCIEIGAFDGVTHSNTYLLRRQGWDALLFDQHNDIPEYNLHKGLLLAENINQLIAMRRGAFPISFLAINEKRNAFYFWKALDVQYAPDIVMIAYNGLHSATEDRVTQYRPFSRSNPEEQVYSGASMLAMYHLGRFKGYSLVYANQKGSFLFFVKNSVMDALAEQGISFKNCNDVQKLARHKECDGAVHLDNHLYLTSQDLLK